MGPGLGARPHLGPPIDVTHTKFAFGRLALGSMAGMPLFAHAGREKLTPPLLSAPLKPIKFCGSKTRISPI